MPFVLSLLVRALVRLLVLACLGDGAKDLEILVLRQQLRVLGRKTGRPRFTALDRTLLAAASRAIPRARWTSFLVTPQTLLRWHRELVRRKWTYRNGRKPGRPPIDPELAALVLRMARENPRWGCVRIAGELRKLGIRVSATTIRTLLRRHGFGPAPRRSGPTWTQFLRAQAAAIVACDFFTVETIRLQTPYVLFFIELSTRRVLVAGVTDSPGSAWVLQQARNTAMDLDDRARPTRFLLRDHDATFTGSFDEVFRAQGAEVIRTRSRLRRPTPMLNGGSRACGRSVLTGRCARPAASAADPACLRPALQPAAAAPRSGAGRSRAAGTEFDGPQP